MPKRIVLCGGGTAGHVMPNLALLPYLEKAFDEIHYIGSADGLEADILKPYRNVGFHTISCTKLVRSLHPKNLLIPFRLQKSVGEAKRLLRELAPDVIFSKGGYVALPVCLAAKGIPLVMHESDLGLGLANRLAYGRCDKLLTSFLLDPMPAKAVHTGAPLRRELYFGRKDAVQKEFPFRDEKPLLLVTGGSQGAVSVNRAVYGALDDLLKKFNVIHLVGKKNIDGKTRPGYYQLGFTDRMADLLAAADFVVSRGGANTLFELVALKKPALVIPLGRAQSRGDQIHNAEYFRRRNCVNVLMSESLTPTALSNALDTLKADASRLTKGMSEAKHIDGTAKISQILQDCIRE
ncbi:MAG: UDP-N-acetylglucosamine--N-acetylmuramyl-(pentapeptide) pyrophosphoryl-undecaprenol N-acetylglucosamine transferase [Clostridiales bacterium]|jgi:UDP-N-acetylglucosamine--N-acetylmuramyl-(pentapeptide) pyrophosphoryl-undecaprenol N-acetylglucosamine transferase|nr:UDP-N-acetylglucosamine--N-acetylmuramyl-(pentapeptide) pyrophosphoryl-undecaprenol N-acetylglucosamine transferase [Clostridiales bacterium]